MNYRDYRPRRAMRADCNGRWERHPPAVARCVGGPGHRALASPLDHPAILLLRSNARYNPTTQGNIPEGVLVVGTGLSYQRWRECVAEGPDQRAVRQHRVMVEQTFLLHQKWTGNDASIRQPCTSFFWWLVPIDGAMEKKITKHKRKIGSIPYPYTFVSHGKIIWMGMQPPFSIPIALVGALLVLFAAPASYNTQAPKQRHSHYMHTMRRHRTTITRFWLKHFSS